MRQPAPYADSLPTNRVVCAFAAAPAASACPLALAITFAPMNVPGVAARMGLAYGIFGYLWGAALTFVLGVPAFLLLRRRVRAEILPAALVGAAIGALPWILLVGALLVARGPEGLYVFDSPKPLTAALMAITANAVFGAFGGAVFWFVAAWTPTAK